MDRMRIAGYMVASAKTAHVQSFIDVTNIVKWRENKNTFEERRGEIEPTHLFSWKQLPKR
jgi:hypothetical protein